MVATMSRAQLKKVQHVRKLAQRWIDNSATSEAKSVKKKQLKGEKKRIAALRKSKSG